MRATRKCTVLPIILLLSVCYGHSKARKIQKQKGHGLDIDNPNVPKESKLENILESEAIFENNSVKKPKHLHKYDKKWQEEENHDRHNADSTKVSLNVKNNRKKRTFKQYITLWPNKTIAYQVDNESFNDLNKFMTTLNAVVAIFSAETCIKWKLWNEALAEELGHSNYVTFRNGNGCSASIGFTKGYATLGQPVCTSASSFVHEMLHVTGMSHEQVRYDRDQYVMIHWENIIKGRHSNFIKSNNSHDGTLDPHSVMQYGVKAFSKNKLKTIEFKNKEYEFLTRLTRNYSFYDIKELNTAYKCDDICQDPPSSCQNYGFVNHNCVCRCPDGLMGVVCNERKGNCGSYINLTSGEIREIKSPGWPNAYDVNLNCVWLIHAPDKHRVKVTITDMDLAWNEDEERCYHWLEMHTNLIGEPGLIRCGKLSGLSSAEYLHNVNTEAGVLLLNFDSTFASDKTPTSGFRLEVEAFKSGCLSTPCLMGSTCNEGNNDFTFTCSCVPGYSGPLCDQVEADATVTCDMESDFGDHCFLVQESYEWNIDDNHQASGITTYASQGEMFGKPTTSTSELISGVTFKDGNRCLAFDYINNGGTKVGGLIVSYQKNNEITAIFNADGNEGSEWQTFHANISTSEGFKLVFQGKKLYGRTTALDNVIVAPGFCGSPCVLVNPCDNGGICVPSSDNLDFTCQCTNGYLGRLCETPSIHTTFTCDFERNMPCFLIQEVLSENSTEWIVNVDKTPSYYTGPDGAISGDFYSFINAANAQPNDTAVYKYEYQNLPETKRCLMFYYHMRGKEMGTLIVKISDRNGLQTTPWTKNGYQSNQWLQAIIDLPSTEDMKIYIQGIVGSGKLSDIAIDDVILRPGICGCESSPCQNGGICTNDASFLFYTCTCPLGYGGLNCDTRNYSPLICDLESGEEDCFLTQDSTDNFDWTRHQGETPTADTGPSGAYGTGQYYYYMESSYRTNEVARLYTTGMFKGDICLKFNYHMYGLKTGSMEVKTNTKSVFLRRGDQLNQWHYAVIPVNAEEDLQLIFEGTVGPGWKSDIAIDDIILEPRPCGCSANPCKNGGSCEDTSGDVAYICHCATGFSGSECNNVGNRELKCTLEDNDGDCFLIQDQTERQNWIKHSGNTPTSETGPTEAFGDGTYYYYMEASNIPEGDIAMLGTTSTFEDMDRCLRFNYYMYGAGLGKLIVKANGLNVFSVTGNQGPQWRIELIDISHPLHNITIEGVRGTTPKSDIGVDDIILHPHSCEMAKKRQLLQELGQLEELS